MRPGLCASATSGSEDLCTPPPRNPICGAVIRGLLVGLVFQALLAPIQPLIEPTYVWVEVGVGVVLAFSIAEFAVMDLEPHWRHYRNTLLAAAVSLAVPIVLYETLIHVLLPAPGIVPPTF